MDVSCPQCGNPNLDVDAQNNVVFCKKCGFAVKVDPQTGNVTPISEGGAAAPAESAQSQPSYSGGRVAIHHRHGSADVLPAVFRDTYAPSLHGA